MDRRESQESRENLEHPAHQEHRASLRMCLAKCRRHRPANLVQAVLRVHLDHPARLVSLARQSHLAALAPIRRLDHLVHQARLAPQARKVNKAHRAIKVRQLNHNHPFLAKLANLEMSAQLDLSDLLATMAKTATPALAVEKETKARLVHLVAMACRVLLVRLVHQVHPARKVFVQNIAHWTGVYFSRTEVDANQAKIISLFYIFMMTKKCVHNLFITLG